MTDGKITWMPKLPQRPSSGKKMNLLGERRNGLVGQWKYHAQEAHHWGERFTENAADPAGLRACADCAEYQARLRESETWTE